MAGRRSGLVVGYLAAQAFLVGAWWVVLCTVPATRPPFVIADWPLATLSAFALPDVAVIVGGSAIAAYGVHTARPWARTLLAAVTGAVVYATLWCLGAVLATGAGWLGVALMLPAGVGSGWALARCPR